MKTHKYLLSGLAIFFLLILVSTAVAGIFDDDSENWRRIFGELKKINARLVTLETGKLKAMQRSQEEQLRNIEELKMIIPELRGAIEQNQAQAGNKMDDLSQRIGELESRIQAEQAEIKDQIRKQGRATNRLESGLAVQFEQLKTSMAGDMESFARTNQNNFKNLSNTNSASLEKIIEQLKAQNQNLNDVKKVFTADLIPAMAEQNEETRDALIAGLTELNEKSLNTMIAGFDEAESNNKKMIEILQLSLNEDMEAKNRVEFLGENLEKTGNNIILIQETLVKLRDILAGQMDTLAASQSNLETLVENDIKNTEIVHKNLGVADQKINALAEGFKALNIQTAAVTASLGTMKGDVAASTAEVKAFTTQSESQLNNLLKSTKDLIAKVGTQSGQANLSLKNIERQLKSVDVANEKLSKLIGILKSIVAEQGRIDKVLRGQTLLSKSHQGIKTTQAQIRKAQADAKKALSDLARKANVNISRNDAIKKSLADLKKK